MIQKKIWIAGGASGIGLSLAARLQEKGHEITILCRSVPENNLFEHRHYDALAPQVSDVPETIDGFVYCPGTVNLKPFHRISADDFRNDWQVNAEGAVYLLQQLYPALKKSLNASVVLYSTVAVQTGMPFHASIAMAKGAIEGLTRSLAAEWAPQVRVNAIAPSLTKTKLTEKLWSRPEQIEAASKRHPLQRIGESSDIAALADFLLSDDSGWITGQVIHADGGLGALRPL
jgi:NAD(P)-dependent dehydrogenase (short-subunit alcohol dehydrogenase family)